MYHSFLIHSSPGYYKQCCDEHWGTRVSFPSGFLSVYATVSFKVCVSLLIFCLVDLSIGMSGVLKSPTIIVLPLISHFIIVSICLTY